MLRNSWVKADFQAELQAKLQNSSNPPDTTPETVWEQLKSTVLQTSEEIVGYTVKKSKDWFDENDAVYSRVVIKEAICSSSSFV